MAYVYRHIRLDNNEPFYIGIGIREKYRRASTIVRRNQFWKNIVAKTDWISEIIFDEISIDEAKKKEIEFIKIYGRKDKGEGTLVNLTDGGDGTTCHIVSEETKITLSKFNKGKKLSEAHKKKISESHKNKKFSEETLQKMRDAKLGKKQSEETIKKRSLKLIGNKSNTGKKLPFEQREKMAASQKRRRLNEFRNKRILNGQVL